MHKFWVGLIFSFSFFNGLMAECSGFECSEHSYDLEILSGYRQDYLRWDLAGSSKRLPVLSRLTWKDINSYDIEGRFVQVFCQDVYFKAKGDYGWIFNGKNQDSDYRLSDHSSHVIEFSRSDNNAGKGYVWDGSVSIGHPLEMPEPLRQLFFMPLIGYSLHFQNFRMFKGFQTIDSDNSSYEGAPFSGLNSSYRILWQSPWIGFDLSFCLNEKLLFTQSFEYHIMNYHAKGHWNLREDILDDFHHNGWGYGYFNEVGIKYSLCSTWDMGCLFKFNFARVCKGKDKTLWREPFSGSIIQSKGRLRNIYWASWNASFLLAYYF